MTSIQKYSVDEGEDAELADLESDDKMDEDEDKSGSSFSETSSIEGEGGVNVDNSAIDNISQQLVPVIRERVNAWPKRGVHLQLKTVDPSVSVEEWLKLNQEFTTTSTKVKKTVVQEANKTTTTSTKQSKTTTKKASFDCSFVPRLMAIEAAENQTQIVPQIREMVNDTAGIHISNETQKDQPTLPKAATEVKQLPVSIELSKLRDLSVIDKSSKFARPKQPNKQQYPLRKYADSSVIGEPTLTKPKQSTKRQCQLSENKVKQKPKQMESKGIKKIAQLAVMLRDSGNRRCLRSEFKANIVPQVQNEKPIKEPLRMKQTKNSSKKYKNPVELPSDELQLISVVPCNKNTESVHRSKSQLNDRQVNRSETCRRLREVRVNVKRLASPIAHYNQTFANLNSEEQTSVNRIAKKSMKRRPQQQPEIVVYSPNSDTLLGTKITETSMLVTKRDYTKLINPKYVQRANVFDRSIIPINRRVIFQPPMNCTNVDNTYMDSECEDVLLSSYLDSGRFVQVINKFNKNCFIN